MVKVHLDRDRLVAEYGRAIADAMIAEAQAAADAEEQRPAAPAPETRKA